MFKCPVVKVIISCHYNINHFNLSFLLTTDKYSDINNHAVAVLLKIVDKN